jgi:type II secretory pathway component PulC
MHSNSYVRLLGALGAAAQLSLAAAGRAQAGDPTPRSETGLSARGEREYIRTPPRFELPRPTACRPELQAALRLSGTVYDERHPELSLAILGAPSTRKTAVYRCGSRWGSLHILEVRPRAVLVSTETEDPCWIPLTRPSASPPAPRAAPPARASSHRSRTAFTSDELEQSIQRVQPGVYRVDRTLLERAMSRAAQIARTTRTRTITSHGSPVGLALTRIASDGLFEHLGLKRDDLLKTVNGFQVASVDGMLSARTQLASASRLSLSLVRAGKPVTLEYRMR